MPAFADYTGVCCQLCGVRTGEFVCIRIGSSHVHRCISCAMIMHEFLHKEIYVTNDVEGLARTVSRKWHGLNKYWLENMIDKYNENVRPPAKYAPWSTFARKNDD